MQFLRKVLGYIHQSVVFIIVACIIFAWIAYVFWPLLQMIAYAILHSLTALSWIVLALMLFSPFMIIFFLSELREKRLRQKRLHRFPANHLEYDEREENQVETKGDRL